MKCSTTKPGKTCLRCGLEGLPAVFFLHINAPWPTLGGCGSSYHTQRRGSTSHTTSSTSGITSDLMLTQYVSRTAWECVISGYRAAATSALAMKTTAKTSKRRSPEIVKKYCVVGMAEENNFVTTEQPRVVAEQSRQSTSTAVQGKHKTRNFMPGVRFSVFLLYFSITFQIIY